MLFEVGGYKPIVVCHGVCTVTIFSLLNPLLVPLAEKHGLRVGRGAVQQLISYNDLLLVV